LETIFKDKEKNLHNSIYYPELPISPTQSWAEIAVYVYFAFFLVFILIGGTIGVSLLTSFIHETLIFTLLPINAEIMSSR